MYNVIEYSDNYSKTSGILRQYLQPCAKWYLNRFWIIWIKITVNIPAGGNAKDVEIVIPLKYLSKFWRSLEMSLINCEINLILLQVQEDSQ